MLGHQSHIPICEPLAVFRAGRKLICALTHFRLGLDFLLAVSLDKLAKTTSNQSDTQRTHRHKEDVENLEEE